jgi:hypothetical protein
VGKAAVTQGGGDAGVANGGIRAVTQGSLGSPMAGLGYGGDSGRSHLLSKHSHLDDPREEARRRLRAGEAAEVVEVAKRPGERLPPRSLHPKPRRRRRVRLTARLLLRPLRAAGARAGGGRRRGVQHARCRQQRWGGGGGGGSDEVDERRRERRDDESGEATERAVVAPVVGREDWGESDGRTRRSLCSRRRRTDWRRGGGPSRSGRRRHGRRRLRPSTPPRTALCAA